MYAVRLSNFEEHVIPRVLSVPPSGPLLTTGPFWGREWTTKVDCGPKMCPPM